jgi:hypothetical protein
MSEFAKAEGSPASVLYMTTITPSETSVPKAASLTNNQGKNNKKLDVAKRRILVLYEEYISLTTVKESWEESVTLKPVLEPGKRFFPRFFDDVGFRPSLPSSEVPSISTFSIR